MSKTKRTVALKRNNMNNRNNENNSIDSKDSMYLLTIRICLIEIFLYLYKVCIFLNSKVR